MTKKQLLILGLVMVFMMATFAVGCDGEEIDTDYEDPNGEENDEEVINGDEEVEEEEEENGILDELEEDDEE